MVNYRYLGYTYPSVPDGWEPIVRQMLRDIDRKIRPWYVPRFILNWMYWLASGNSVVRVRSRFFYNFNKRFAVFRKCFITDIKDKYGGLRVYGGFSDEVEKIVDAAVQKCDTTCEKCGSEEEVKIVNTGWLFNFCIQCRLNVYKKNIEQFNHYYRKYIPDGYYGLSFYNKDVNYLLIRKFSEFIEKYPDFKFYQLKLKFGVPRLYIDGPPRDEVFEIEEKIARLLKSEEE